MGTVTFDELDALSTEELRERAFERARQRRDLSFLWSIFEHLPSNESGDDGSLGIQSSVDDAIALWKESTGHEYGGQEPLIRAAFIDYLLKH
ncbi:MAG: hypothetical protein AUI14_01130 [Actinobacteria bacterium 13_2_20CM_2_71_6]|nr:MAG: hypothetical protein AUI14_01130 [Actinobacteria bacterium 13_2_20CM_2_71_6]